MREKMGHSSMLHLNGNLLAAIDVETTGFIAGYHDLIQVAVLALGANLEPLKTVTPFYLNLTPKRPENIDRQAMQINRLDFTEIVKNSIDPDVAADMFDEWFERLDLGMAGSKHKKIMPLWSNGGFDKGFLVDWLGKEHYEHYFHFHERDTQSLALSINDRYDFHVEPVPFPKVGLGYLASCFNIVNEKAHDALADCVTTARVYKEIITMFLPVNPRANEASGPVVDYSR